MSHFLIVMLKNNVTLNALFVFFLMWKYKGECCSSGVLEDNTTPCCYNFYKDGNQCKGCTEGYFGNNCSDVCQAPSYGLKCAQKCNCSPCHHIYGCVNVSSISTKEETTTLVQTKEADVKNKSLEAIVTIIRLITVPIGSIISLVLLLIITREIIRYRLLSSQT